MRASAFDPATPGTATVRAAAGVDPAALARLAAVAPHALGICPVPAPGISERDFQADVIRLARMLGWPEPYHTFDSRRSAKGFPDLVFVRDRVVYVELKAAKGRVRPEQAEWNRRLLAAGAEAYIWRPGDWATIVETLSRVTR